MLDDDKLVVVRGLGHGFSVADSAESSGGTAAQGEGSNLLSSASQTAAELLSRGTT